jgi:hypothetical protein
MIRILLDECLPKKLKYRIAESDSGFFVKTTPDMGWASLSNGELLKEAVKEFDVFVTSDKNLSFQQAIPSTIMVVLLKAKTNTYEDLLPLIDKLTIALKSEQSGNFLEIV